MKTSGLFSLSSTNLYSIFSFRHHYRSILCYNVIYVDIILSLCNLFTAYIKNMLTQRMNAIQKTRH